MFDRMLPKGAEPPPVLPPIRPPITVSRIPMVVLLRRLFVRLQRRLCRRLSGHAHDVRCLDAAHAPLFFAMTGPQVARAEPLAKSCRPDSGIASFPGGSG